MEHCNNHLKLLKNVKEIQQKEREAWMDTTGQDWNGLHLGNLKKKDRPTFSTLWQIAWIKVFFAQNHVVCDVTIILPVKEFHIVIFEFKLVMNERFFPNTLK